MQLFLRRLSNNYVALLGNQFVAGIATGHRNIFKSKRAGTLFLSIKEILKLGRIIHLIETFIEFSGKIEAETFLFHLVESLGKIFYLLYKFGVFFGKAINCYTVFGDKRFQCFFEAVRIDDSLDRFIDSFGK